MARLFDIDDTPNSDDWYTPRWIFDGLRIEFDIDVAAPEGGVPWIPATTYYTETMDGPSMPWHGTVWCNPPYSDPSSFARKLVEHGDGCLLIRADLSTRWAFHAYDHADALWVPQGRLSFESAEGGIKGGSSFTSVMLGYGRTAVAGMRRLEEVNGGTRLLGA